MIGGSLFRGRRMQAHIEADVAAGVTDPEAFVVAFRASQTPESTYVQQKHRRTLTKIAERDELQDDARAARRASNVTWTAATRAIVLIVLFGITEIFTMSLVLIGLGVRPREAYGTAVIIAALAVLLIEGATSTAHRGFQFLCYGALTGMMLCLAWIRAHAFFGGGDTIQQVVAGVIATAAAVGSGVGLHIYRKRAHAAARETLRVRKLVRDSRPLNREISVAEKALIKSDVLAQKAAAEDAELRTVYARLHAIARAAHRGDDALEPI